MHISRAICRQTTPFTVQRIEFELSINFMYVKNYAYSRTICRQTTPFTVQRIEFELSINFMYVENCYAYVKSHLCIQPDLWFRGFELSINIMYVKNYAYVKSHL
jgi:hypothetical protein